MTLFPSVGDWCRVRLGGFLHTGWEEPMFPVCRSDPRPCLAPPFSLGDYTARLHLVQ